MQPRGRSLGREASVAVVERRRIGTPTWWGDATDHARRMRADYRRSIVSATSYESACPSARPHVRTAAGTDSCNLRPSLTWVKTSGRSIPLWSNMPAGEVFTPRLCGRDVRWTNRRRLLHAKYAPRGHTLTLEIAMPASWRRVPREDLRRDFWDCPNARTRPRGELAFGTNSGGGLIGIRSRTKRSPASPASRPYGSQTRANWSRKPRRRLTRDCDVDRRGQVISKGQYRSRALRSAS